jgi:opacity protein-like surface antigen
MTARVIGVASIVGATLLAAAMPRAAHADADEASLDVEALGGVARVEDGLAKKTASGPLVGLGGRFTFARSNLLQWEGRVAVATASANYPGLMTNVGGVPIAGDLTRRTLLGRLELGATLRFGVRFIPTLHLGVGAQARRRGTGELDGVAVDGGGGTSVDLIGAGAVGFDYRLGPRTIAGVSVGATIAVPLGGPAYQAIEGGLHFAHYWYPRL